MNELSSHQERSPSVATHATYAITDLAPEDVDAAHALVVQLIEFLYPDSSMAREGYISWFGREDLLRRRESPDWLHLIATIDGRAVGIAFTSVDAGIGTLLWLYVHPDARRCGVGAALVEETCRRLAERGCHKSDVLTRMSFPHLQSFYEGLGFVVAGRFPKYRYGIDTLYLIRDLEQMPEFQSVERKAVANS